MALFPFVELKKNSTLRSTAVTVYLNTMKILDMRAVTENFTGTSATYTRLVYSNNDNAVPDVFYTTTAIATLNTTINTDATGNTTGTILLTVQSDVLVPVTQYTKYVDPLFIHSVYIHPVTSTDSVVFIDAPGRPFEVLRVDETQAAIVSAANA